MEKREFKVLRNCYYGIGKVCSIWRNEIYLLDKKNLIRKIYEVVDDEYNEVWYLIRDINENSFIVKNKYGKEYAKNMMNCYREKYKFNKISTKLIKMFDKNIFPIIFKISSDKYLSFYNEETNKNFAFFDNYYTKINNQYKCVRIYRNKVEFETFSNEEDAIYWCSDYTISKIKIINSAVRPLNLFDKVYIYEY